jgi:ribose 5-phosphate isomerase B
MKVFVASDHAGFELKEHVKEFLNSKGYEVEDCGAFTFNKDDDYPDFIAKASEKVSKDSTSMGIVIGGSGNAEAMTANKFSNIRCALFYAPALAVESVDVNGRKSDDPFEIVRLAREHNDANMLSLSARFLDRPTAEQAVELFLQLPFPGDERHVRRIEKIKRIELVHGS